MGEFGKLNSWIRRSFFSCIVLLVAVFIVDLKYTVLLINGIVLFLYLLLVALVTIWIAFTFLQNLLKINKPLEYSDKSRWYYKYFVHMYESGTNTTGGDNPKGINERIEDFAADVDKLFVSKWYTHISQDETFPLESRVLIEDVVRRFLQVIVLVDSKKLVHGTLVIFLKHLKEFKRAQRRKLKNGGNVDDFYRFSHVGSKSFKAQEHFIQELTADVLRQFITWDLWNSLPCRALVSILSRKLTNYMLIHLSKPGFINYKILSSCVSTRQRQSLKLDEYSFVSLSIPDCTHFKPPLVGEINGKTSDHVDAGTPKKLLEKTVTNVPKEKTSGAPNQVVDEVDFSSSAVSEPVKIYESKSTDKTWRNSSDLECISLGQDPLTLQDSDPDSQIQSFIERKLWKDTTESLEADDKKEAPQEVVSLMEIPAEQVTTKPSPPGFLRPTTTSAATLLTNTMKPIGSLTESTLHNMKELQQSTVNNVMKPVSQATTTAMHKIGDLQDEAAGVMEGIIDFGMAGLRKGLRLTGLQDNISGDLKKGNDSKKANDKKIAAKLTKLPHVASEEVKITTVVDQDDSVWTKESPNFDGQILLEKTPGSASKLISQELTKIKESVCEMAGDAKHDIPLISTDSTDSPEPEYEETPDLATTIARLRSLLQQKSSESNMTTPALSPMPQDDILKTTPVDPAVELNEVDGVMPSLYKFCARTATGVFQNTLNTIKTALPGTMSDMEVHDNKERWTYIEADVTNEDLFPRMEKLLAERRVFCTVDTAYEAVDSLDLLNTTTENWIDNTPTFDDELDDFEVQIPIVRVLADIFCELVGDTNASITQEPVIKSILLLTGTIFEKEIETRADKFVRNLNKFIGHLPQNYNQSALPMKLDEMVNLCVEAIPGMVKQSLSKSTIEEALRLFISSMQSQKVNEDVLMQIFELYASQIIFASSKLTPAFSA